MENLTFSGGGVWLGLMIIFEALAIYGLVHIVRCLLRPDPKKNAPLYMFDDSFDGGDLVGK